MSRSKSPSTSPVPLASAPPIGRRNKLSRQLWQLPFQARLSLKPLVIYWQQAVETGNEIDGLLALRVQEQVSQVPDLLRPIADPQALAPHAELIELLMTALLPPAMRHSRMSAAISPVHFETIYATPSFDAVMAANEGEMHIHAPHTSKALLHNKLLWPCSIILEKCYDLNLLEETTLMFHIPDRASELDRFFKPVVNTRFSEITNCEQLPRLSDGTISRLLNELDNEALWLEHFSPHKIDFQGFVWLDLIDVTEAEILSQLKHRLLEKDAFLQPSCRRHIRACMRNLFKNPDLHVGVAPYHQQYDSLVRHGKKLWNSLLIQPERHHLSHPSSIYHKVIQTHETVFVDDLGKLPNRTKIENALLSKGIRNLVIAPLIINRELVGLMELGSPRPGELTALSTIKLQEVLPLFAVAMERSAHERENQVQALIKEMCTAVHPTVEWRFHQAGLRLLEKLEQGQAGEMEPIVFKEVYPLFGITDVRNSSEARNNAIQSDLVQQLTLAQQVLQQALERHPTLVVDELNHRINKFKASLEGGINTGDEATVLEFIRQEVEPMIDHLQGQHPALRRFIDMYRGALDADLRIVYKRRKDYETSIGLLNEQLLNLLKEAEVEAQKLFPHYFEISQTDGIEYNIFVGSSLNPGRTFDQVHLNNLRFWQLKLTCEMARLAAQIKPRLSIPLEVAPLIMVYPSPLAIRFRMDEKRFDVDGAYNLRYEILKKRIDKARIKGSNQRLTQPGHIAIVYSQEKEVHAYQRYLAYLHDKGYVSRQVEQLDIKPLPGVRGLKALRVSVNLYTHVEAEAVDYQHFS